jgi:hypothetical protein
VVASGCHWVGQWACKAHGPLQRAPSCRGYRYRRTFGQCVHGFGRRLSCACLGRCCVRVCWVQRCCVGIYGCREGFVCWLGPAVCHLLRGRVRALCKQAMPLVLVPVVPSTAASPHENLWTVRRRRRQQQQRWGRPCPAAAGAAHASHASPDRTQALLTALRTSCRCAPALCGAWGAGGWPRAGVRL